MNRTLQSAARAGRARTAGVRRAALLPPAERAFFERGFGQDFSQVRVHTGTEAGSMARSLGAKAVAGAEDIAFAPGRYEPETFEGRTLLAHELAHVVQQRRGGAAAPAQVESNARAAAQTVAHGGSVSSGAVGGAEPGLHCDPDEGKKDVVKPAWHPGSPLPSFQLSTPSLLDWSKMQGPFRDRGLRMSTRDMDAIEAERQRIADELRVFGIREDFKLDYKLGTLTYADLINLGIKHQLDDQLSKEQPNDWDRLNTQFDQAHPGWSTPFISKSWSF